MKIEFEKSRENFEPNVLNEPANFDGHWGIQHGEWMPRLDVTTALHGRQVVALTATDGSLLTAVVLCAAAALPAEHSFDVLADTWLSTGNLAHDIGTGTGGKWGVYMNGNMKDRGNLDLHRWVGGWLARRQPFLSRFGSGNSPHSIHLGGCPNSPGQCPLLLQGAVWPHPLHQH